MPNWCNNSIEVHGPLDTIKKLYNAAVDEEVGFLQGMRPMPTELEGTTSPSNEPNWYDWRVNNWGTKWDVDSEGLEFYDNRDGTGSITGYFDSAWSPPINAYDFFISENPDCSIKAMFEEGGMDFAGFYEDGEIDEMDGIHHYCEQVVLGKMKLEDTPATFQRLDEEMGLIESREEWILEDHEAQTTDTEKFIVEGEPVNG